MCAGIEGFGLSKVSWSELVGLHNIRFPSPPLVLQRCLCPCITLGYCVSVWGEWVTWNPPCQNRLQPVFGMAFSGWLITISFSNCPRRCCFSLAHAAQASMARFYFHDISFLCRKAQRTNYQANPLQAHAQASQRQRVRKHVCNGKTPWSNTAI